MSTTSKQFAIINIRSTTSAPLRKRLSKASSILTTSTHSLQPSNPTPQPTGTWLHITYGKQTKRLIIPPNVTVAQARDLCMLRFNVWNQLVGSQEAAEFGLFYSRKSEWLDNQMLLSTYQLDSGDKVELQDRRSFIQVPIDTSRLSSEYSKRSQAWFYTAQTKWCKGWLELQDSRILVCNGLQGNLVWRVDLARCRMANLDQEVPEAPPECHPKYLCLEANNNNSTHVVGVDSAECYQDWSDILTELTTTSESEKEGETTSAASSIYQTPQHSHPAQPQISKVSKINKIPRCFTASVYNQPDWSWGIVVNDGLYGFTDSSSACNSDTKEAQFALHFTHDHDPTIWMATLEQDGRHLVHICSLGNVLVLDVGGMEQCQQWANALCGIGGLGLLPAMCREEADSVSQKSSTTCTDEEAAMAIRKCPSTQSFVSSISQIEWPVPPSTLPDNKIGRMFSDTKPPRVKHRRLHFLKWSSGS